MKIVSILLILIFSTASQAERWVIKNMAPQSLAPEIQVLKTLDFNNSHYTVVELPKNYFSSAQNNLINGHEAFLDAEIFIPDNESLLNDPQSLSETNTEAWHVNNLKYDELPSRRVRRRVTVAIIDTGIDYNHDQLSSQMWINKKEIAGNGIDDDENGYIDDIYGWNMNADVADPLDDHNHGSHCAGIVAGLQKEDSNAQGIAPMVKVMALKVFNRSGRGTSAFLSDVSEAVKYAVDNNAQILSNSWGGYDRDGSRKEAIKMLSDAIDYARANKVIFVASAGNSNQDIDNTEGVKYPVGIRGHENLIGVAAYDQRENKAYFSSYGLTQVQVAAPGVKIMSTVTDNKWKNMSGTSMAAPVVSGLLARGLSDGMSYEEALEALQATSRSTKIQVRDGLIDPLAFLNWDFARK